MKKKYIATGLICALTLSAVACGQETTVSSEVQSELMEPIPETSTGADDANKTENTSADDANKTENTGADDTNKTEAGSEDANKIETATSDLYEALKQGTGTVKYRGTGDRTAYIETASILEKGKSYTIDEIIKACESIDIYSGDGQPNVTYKQIDCGQDGVPELLVNIEFGAATNLTMIVKEIDNELVMCYDQDGGDRFYSEVSDNGVIVSSGSSAANVHGFDYAFVDANGDYHFFYGVEETLCPMDEFYAYKSGEDYAVVSLEGLDCDHIGVRDYYFEADYKDRNHYIEYYVMDDNYEDVSTDADFEDSNEIKQHFAAAGIQTYTKAQMEQKLKDRAAEIGAGELGYPMN